MKCLINGTLYNIKQGSLRALQCIYYIKFIYEEVWELYKSTENILINEIFSKKTIMNWFINPYCKMKLKLKMNNIIKEYNNKLKKLINEFTIDNIKDSDINEIINAIIIINFNEDSIKRIKEKYEFIINELSQCDFNSKDKKYLEDIKDKVSTRIDKLKSLINKLLLFDSENKIEYIEKYIKYEKYGSKEKNTSSYKDIIDYIEDIIIYISYNLKISKTEASEMTFLDYIKIRKNDNKNREKNIVDMFFATKGDTIKHINNIKNN
jgi:hypothetical protein